MVSRGTGSTARLRFNAAAGTTQDALVVRSVGRGLRLIVAAGLPCFLGLGECVFSRPFRAILVSAEKMFDEVYFARAAEEYLHRRYIYENTHPPVTKLLITLSTLMFGDNSNGWRFLDVVFGAAAVWLLYLLLKRVTASTLFASYGAVLFMFDGMHYVQSRIATPESFVVFFALATLYTFYRYWLAAQVRCENVLRERQVWSRIVATVGSALAAVAVVALRFPHESFPARLIAALYVFAGFYLVYRLLLERHTAKTIRRVSYPDGSMFLSSEDNSTVLMPDGGVITKGTMRHGDRSAVGKGCKICGKTICILPIVTTAGLRTPRRPARSRIRPTLRRVTPASGCCFPSPSPCWLRASGTASWHSE